MFFVSARILRIKGSFMIRISVLVVSKVLRGEHHVLLGALRLRSSRHLA
ncbi:unnamed protein product [Amoebophrya sp. A25]|nr:unnamed protein product [Amoebophrya sp. A25]|eukprot:GSA25T00026422001.1